MDSNKFYGKENIKKIIDLTVLSIAMGKDPDYLRRAITALDKDVLREQRRSSDEILPRSIHDRQL